MPTAPVVLRGILLLLRQAIIDCSLQIDKLQSIFWDRSNRRVLAMLPRGEEPFKKGERPRGGRSEGLANSVSDSTNRPRANAPRHLVLGPANGARVRCTQMLCISPPPTPSILGVREYETVGCRSLTPEYAPGKPQARVRTLPFVHRSTLPEQDTTS